MPTPPGAGPSVGLRPGAAARGAGDLLRGRRATTLTIVALVVFTWPLGAFVAGAGLDNSWVVGLGLAVSRGLVWGHQIVFTYGPLGIFAVPRAVTGGVLLAGVLGAAAIHIALVGVLVCALRSRLPLLLATLVALVALLIVVATGLPPLEDIAFGIVAIALSVPPDRAERASWTLALAGGVFAGLALLVKLNDGVAVSAIVGVGLLGGPRPLRALLLGALAFALSLATAWLALGQPLGALPDYVRTGYSLASGYPDAMGEDLLVATGHWEAPVVIASAVILSTGAWLSLAQEPRRRRAALAVAVLIVHYFLAREMFVRWGGGHASFVALLVPIALMIPWRRQDRNASFGVAGALAIASLSLLGSDGVGLANVFAPVSRAQSLFTDIGTVASPGSAIAGGRTAIRLADAVPPALARSLNGHCVNVEPWEVAAVFAYPSWRWCPIGVMQSYAAYTTTLDDLDAAGYANARTGPDRVLRQANLALDLRNPSWESPAAMLSLLCHFTESSRAGQWQVLARIPNRCGKARTLLTIHSPSRGPMLIPAGPPNMVITAEIHGLQIGPRERFTTLFTRAAIRDLVINRGPSYRVVPDTLADGLILDVPARADYAAPFGLGLSVRSISAEVNHSSVPFSVTLIGTPIKPKR